MREQQRWVISEGVKLAVREWDGPGAPVLLLHGLASSSHMFDLVAPRLAAAHRVFAYDQRGHGESGKPQSGYDFEHVAADCHEVITTLGIVRPILVGHSWGANVALELALRHPQKIAGVILLDGGFASMGRRMSWEEARERLAPPEIAGTNVDRFVRFVREELGQYLTWRPAHERIVLSYVSVDREGHIRPRLSRANHMRILRTIWEQDPETLLRRVHTPTLVLVCRWRDPPPEEAEFVKAKVAAARRAKAIRGPVRVAFMEGIHDVPLQRPAALAARIRDFARNLESWP